MDIQGQGLPHLQGYRMAAVVPDITFVLVVGSPIQSSIRLVDALLRAYSTAGGQIYVTWTTVAETLGRICLF